MIERYALTPENPMNTHSRRDLLKRLAAGLGAMALGRRLFGQQPAHGRIDVHHHYRLPGMKLLIPDDGWTPARSVEQMNRFGIATAVVSCPVIYSLYDGTPQARGLARSVNEFAAKMVRDYPRRFGFFAALPLPDQEGSLKEIEYACETLKADGIGLFTNTGNKWPGDPAFEPVFAELNRRKAVVFLHPIVGNCCHNLIPGAPDPVLEFDFDTTRAVTSLLVNGTLTRFPEIRFIVSHSGAAVPTLAGRIQDRIPKDRAAILPKGALYELQRLYYEVAHATYPWPMAALANFVPPSHILFGTDYFFEPIETTVEQIPNSAIPSETWQLIYRTNAEQLFPRLKV